MEIRQKIILTVTAHPDDEVLGFGGSSFVLAAAGHKVYNLILSGNVEARNFRPEIEELIKHSCNAQQIIGAQKPIFGPFPNIKFNTIFIFFNSYFIFVNTRNRVIFNTRTVISI